MGITGDLKKSITLAKRVLDRRIATKQLREALKKQSPTTPNKYRIGIYFADSNINIYQLRQWYPVFAQLDQKHPLLYIMRNSLGALQIIHDGVKQQIAYAPKIEHLEKLVATQPLNIIFYVNQNTRNFQMLRYPKRHHVFINHGESDKIFMTTNQHKSYDYAFVAGKQARKRLANALWGYDVQTRTYMTGRPQIDHMHTTPPYKKDNKINVLYAPTWEGDRPSAKYGSIASHGETLINTLIKTGKHRIIYRPHPRSGATNPEYAAANKRIIKQLDEANTLNPQAKHIHDTSAHLGWQLTESDVAICDISAMIYDRLATGKPLLVTRPTANEAQIDEKGYLAHCEWLTQKNAPKIVENIDRVLTDKKAQTQLKKWSQQYFGSTKPGDATKKFMHATEQLLTRQS